MFCLLVIFVIYVLCLKSLRLPVTTLSVPLDMPRSPLNQSVFLKNSLVSFWTTFIVSFWITFIVSFWTTFIMSFWTTFLASFWTAFLASFWTTFLASFWTKFLVSFWTTFLASVWTTYCFSHILPHSLCFHKGVWTHREWQNLVGNRLP